MKLTINPKELLALYNVLYERFETCYDCKEYADDDPRAMTDVQLKQLYGRVKACVIASLSNKMVDPLDSWITGQERKIGELNDQNEGVRKDAKHLATEARAPGVPIVLSAEDTDVLPDTYPRKSPPQPRMPSGGKFHGRRR